MKGICFFVGTLLLLTSSIQAQLAAPERLWARQLPNIFTGTNTAITWDAVAGASRYEVRRSNEMTGSWEFAAETTAPFFREASQPGRRYAVRALSETEAGLFAETVVPQGDPFPGVAVVMYNPEYPHTTTITPTNVLIGFTTSWAAGTDAILEFGPPGEMEWVSTISPMRGHHIFWVTNLMPATAYQYRLTWAGENGIGADHESRVFWTERFMEPVAYGQVLEFDENPLRIVLQGYDFDSANLYFRISRPPLRGTLSAVTQITNVTAQVFYTAGPGPMGEDSFEYVISDGVLESAPATVTILNATSNQRPSAQPAVYTLEEDSPFNITLGGLDPEGAPLTFELVSGPTNGVLTGVPPHLIYAPNANYNGRDAFQFKVRDEERESSPASVELTIAPVDDWPMALPQTVAATEDQPRAITLGASEIDGGSIVWEIVGGPGHGVLSGTVPNLTYLPAADFSGADSFLFRVGNGVGVSDTALVTIDVAPVDDVPVAQGMTNNIFEDQPISLVLQATDVDGGPVTWQYTSWGRGSVTGVLPNITYRPATNYFGFDSVTVRAGNGSAFSAPVTIGFIIHPVDDLPNPTPRNLTATQNMNLAITLTATDVDGGPVTWGIVRQPAHGVLSGVAPNIVYTPETNYLGGDSFRFSSGPGKEAEVTLNVVRLNTRAQITPAQPVYTIYTGQSVSGWIWVTDAENDPQTITMLGGANPNVTISGTNFTFKAPLHWSATHQIGFGAVDPFGVTAGGGEIVTIKVIEPTHFPTSYPQTLLLQEDTALALQLGGTDVQFHPLTYIVVQGPAYGVLTGTGKNLTYRPNTNFNGTDRLLYKVSDGYQDSLVEEITLGVLAVDDPPTAAVAQTVSTEKNQSVALTLGVVDVDGGPANWQIVAGPTNGTLSGTAPNLTYLPRLDFAGTDSFRYSVGAGLEATVTINVNSPPYVIAPISNQTADNATTSLSLDLASVFGDDETPDELTLSVASSNGTLVAPSISGSLLNLQLSPTISGEATVTLRATDPSGASVETTFLVTVQRGIAVRVVDASNTEGSSSGVVFNLQLSQPSANTVTVSYATTGGAATAGLDFTPTSGVVTFAPGVTNRTVKVSTLQDTIDEIDEVFTFTLSNAVNAYIQRGAAVGTIVDNDTASWSVQDITLTETNGAVVQAIFRVALSTASSRDVSVTYATANSSALSGQDFTAKSGTLLFPAGAAGTHIVTVDILDDTMDEPNQVFNLALSGAVNSSISRASGRCTIIDDDAPPVVTIANASAAEGNSSSRNITFTATLSEPSANRARVQFATADGTATAGVDYTARTGEIVFDAGVTVRTFTVSVRGDVTPESVETILVNFSTTTPTLVTLGTAQAVGSILSEE